MAKVGGTPCAHTEPPDVAPTDPRDDDVVLLLARRIPRRIPRGRAARRLRAPRALRPRWIGRRKPKPSARKAPIAVGRLRRRRIGRSRGGGSPRGRALARRALLAGGAAAAPALLAAQSALAKKANPGKPGAQKAKIDVPKPVTNLDLNGRRLVAVGDIHGDFAQAMKALELSKCMNSEGKWIGGTTVLVQVGDILDRGDNELAIMRKFQKLAREAKEAGGDVVVMNGNHEIMNVMGDFRYVTNGAFGECRRWVEKRRAREAEKLGEEDVEPLPPVPDGVTPNSYYGLWARRDLFLPGGEMAVKMASNPTVLQVGDTVFAHAGITENHVDYGFQRLNNEVAAWMVGGCLSPPSTCSRRKGSCGPATTAARRAGTRARLPRARG